MQKRRIAQLSLAHLCSDINAGALPALMAFLAVARGYSYTEVALVMFVYSVVASLAQPVCGWLSDRRPTPTVMPAAILLMGLSIGSVGLSGAFWQVIVLASLAGIGSALFHPEAARWTNLLSGKRKGSSMSLFAIGGNLGFALGPVVIGALVPLVGLGGSLLFAILGIADSVFLFRRFRTMPSEGLSGKDGAAGSGSALRTNRWKPFAWLFGVVVNRAIFLQSFLAFTALYWMKTFGVDASGGSWALALFSVAGIASNMAGGMISDRVGCVPMLRVTQAASLPALLFFVWTGNMYVALLLLAVIAFTVQASFSPIILLGQSYLPRNIGLSAGVTMGIGRSAGGLAMPLLGFAADHLGLGTAFLLLALPALLGMFCAFRLTPPEDGGTDSAASAAGGQQA